MASSDSLLPVRGIRERAKVERQERIKAAATATFREKGYASATTREIAQRAGVAKGTIFLYAADKRDLLRLVINDDLIELTRTAFENVGAAEPLVDQLMAVFAPRYEYWGAYPDLALQALDHPGRGDSLLEDLRALLVAAQKGGGVREDADPGAIADILVAIYHRDLFRWLHDQKTPLDAAISRLRSALTLTIDGIGP